MLSKEKFKNSFLNILYPQRCPVCHDIAMPRGQKICPECRKKLQPIKEPRCCLCSKPLGSPEEELCRDCRKGTHYYDQGIGIFPYNSILQESLFKLKYGGRQEYGEIYGQIAVFYAKEQIQKWKINMIIPVPLHRKRMEKRGYNQAEIIAKAIGRSLNICVESQALKRIVNTKAQKNLGAMERKQNLRNAFQAEKKLKGRKILLVDDIYTTGSTVDAAAKVLKEAHAEKVFFLTIAIGADN